MMITIPLSQGLVTVVDDDAPTYVLEANWYAKMSGHHGTFYAVSKSFGKQNTRLHRILAGASEDMVVDHVNGDSLDNRLANLRICTDAENRRNRKPNCNSPTGFKGVKVVRRSCGFRYKAAIGLNGASVYLGTFATAIEAAAAYDEAAIRLYGAFARLNLGAQQGLLRSAA